MTDVSDKTTLPTQTYRFRRWLSLGLLVLCVLGLVQGLLAGCIEFSRVGIVDCQADNPAGYWVTLLLLLVISISLFFIFLSSFGQNSEAVHDAEDAKLNVWLDAPEALPESLYQRARAPTVARVLCALYVALMLLVLWQYDGFQDWVRFSLFVFLSVPLSLAAGFLVQWLGEEVRMDAQGVGYFVLWRGWRRWPWAAISQVRLEGEYVQKGYGLWLYGRAGRLILTPRNFQGDQKKFLLASRKIVHCAMAQNASIQLPADGLEAWLDAIESL